VLVDKAPAVQRARSVAGESNGNLKIQPNDSTRRYPEPLVDGNGALAFEERSLRYSTVALRKSNC
jgi:hypothetical protein